jgi:general secretion pathway protein G
MKTPRGFTVIELMVVLAIIAMLVTVAAPRYIRYVDESREAVLRHDLRAMREALDRFHADKGRYPNALAELVEQRYLRDIPKDPMTELANWVLVPPADGMNGIADIRSSARGKAADNTSYAAW